MRHLTIPGAVTLIRYPSDPATDKPEEAGHMTFYGFLMGFVTPLFIPTTESARLIAKLESDVRNANEGDQVEISAKMAARLKAVLDSGKMQLPANTLSQLGTFLDAIESC